MKWILLVLAIALILRLLKKPSRSVRRLAACHFRLWCNRGYWARHQQVPGRPAKVRLRLSLTTSPTRIAHLEPVLASLQEGQLVRAESIQINVPHKFGRTGEPYVIPDFLTHRGVIVHRCDDVGPATKSVPTLLGLAPEDDVWVVVVDDDMRYPPEFLAVLEEAVLRDPAAAHGISCVEWRLPLAEGGPFVEVTALEGVSGLAAHRRFFGPDFPAYFARVLENHDSKFQDDFSISNYLALHGVPRRSAANELVNPRRMRSLGCHLPQGFGWDALHLGGSSTPNEQRYINGSRYLRPLGLLGFPVVD